MCSPWPWRIGLASTTPCKQPFSKAGCLFCPSIYQMFLSKPCCAPMRSWFKPVLPHPWHFHVWILRHLLRPHFTGRSITQYPLRCHRTRPLCSWENLLSPLYCNFHLLCIFQLASFPSISHMVWSTCSFNFDFWSVLIFAIHIVVYYVSIYSVSGKFDICRCIWSWRHSIGIYVVVVCCAASCIVAIGGLNFRRQQANLGGFVGTSSDHGRQRVIWSGQWTFAVNVFLDMFLELWLVIAVFQPLANERHNGVIRRFYSRATILFDSFEFNIHSMMVLKICVLCTYARFFYAIFFCFSFQFYFVVTVSKGTRRTTSVPVILQGINYPYVVFCQSFYFVYYSFVFLIYHSSFCRLPQVLISISVPTQGPFWTAINPTDQVQLSATLTAASAQPLAVTTQWICTSNNFVLLGNDPTLFSSSVPPVLLFNPNSFQGGITYSFALIVTDIANSNRKSQGSVSFVLNEPPSAGRYTLIYFYIFIVIYLCLKLVK